jgi:hypothetical protein
MTVVGMLTVLLGVGIILFSLVVKSTLKWDKKDLEKDRKNGFHQVAAMYEKVQANLKTLQERKPFETLPISQSDRANLERIEALFTKFLRIVHEPVQASDLVELKRTYGSIEAILGSLKNAIKFCKSILSVHSEQYDVIHDLKDHIENTISDINTYIVSKEGEETLKTIDEDTSRTLPRKLNAFMKQIEELQINKYDTLPLYDQNNIRQTLLSISEKVDFIFSILKMPIEDGSDTNQAIKEGFETENLPMGPTSKKENLFALREPFQSIGNPYAPPSTESPLLFQGREFLSDFQR